MFTSKSLFSPRRRGLGLATLASMLLLSLAPSAADAQSAPDARQLLDRYIAEAVQSNLALAQQQAAVRRAEAGVQEANGRFLPSLGLNARYSEFSGVINIGDFINPTYAALNQLIGEPRFPTDINATLPFRQETKLDLQMPLFNGALFGARAAARAQRDLTGSTRDVALRQLVADVQLAWLQVASATRAVQTLEATLPVLDENLRVSERLVGAGQATPDVVLRARAERSDLLQQLEDTRRLRAAAVRGFNLLRNQEPDAPIALGSDGDTTDLAPNVPVDSLGSRAALVTHALRHREELAQVVQNLADNALRYGRSGKRIDISLERAEKGGRPYIRLSVRDYGPGIAKEHLPRLTERFYRVDAAASRARGGTGLGLAIVKHIVNRHQGILQIESEIGEGSTFSVLLPLAAQ